LYTTLDKITRHLPDERLTPFSLGEGRVWMRDAVPPLKKPILGTAPAESLTAEPYSLRGVVTVE
jgi:hypothetical protein